MSDWNSALYLKFKAQRTQPAVDLAVRLLGRKINSIIDIGCGPGNSTAVLKKLFPDAKLTGIDSSPDMIEKARREYPGLQFRLCSAAALTGKFDLLFSNACLQWIPDHKKLIPELMGKLNPGGVLAVQIPMNGDEPLYKIIKETAVEPDWGLMDVTLPFNEALSPCEYFDILSGCASDFNIWETKYYHTLADHKALTDWVKSTRLKPYLDFLGKNRGAEFENRIREKSIKAYPVRNSGGIIFGFRRFFFTAVK